MMAIMLCALLFASCDKLDDGDGGLAGEVLPGTWAFSYTIHSEEDPGLEFDYRPVVFRDDATCELLYDDGALHGSYVASGSMIRIVSSDIDGEERVMLWRIVALSASQIVAEYDFTLDGMAMTAVVTLDKQ